MAKFCSYCGKLLQEGEVCDCRSQPVETQTENVSGQPVQAAPTAENAGIQADKIKETASGYMAFLKQYFKEPFSASKKAMSDNNMVVAAISMVIYWLSVFFLMLAAFGKVTGYAEKMMGYWSEIEVKMPFFSTLLFSLLIAVVILALATLGLFLLLKICKANADIKQTLIAAGINSIIPAACTLLAVVCIFISFKLSLFFLILGLIVSAMLAIAMPAKIFDVHSSGTTLCVSAVVFTVIVAISFFINGKLVTSAAGKIEVEDEPIGDMLEEALGELEGMDLEDILGSL